jgi:protein-disulfide isomerase
LTISDARALQRINRGNKQAVEEDIVAIINGREITAAELDASIRMQLYELDLARYKLRSIQLNRLIVEQNLASGTANTESDTEAALAKLGATILLEPPIPPRFEVETGENEIRGNPGAPVSIIEFLDFQSSHSSRTQPVLYQLLEDYGPLLRLVVRDLPLDYHRYARRAAEAAECARSQGRYWRYHDLLLQNQENLAPSDLIHYATTLGLDLKQFQACIVSEKATTAVQEDAAAAKKLGLLSTPVFFINGLYLKGPRKYSDFARLINGELERLGFLDAEVIRNMGIDQCPFRVAQRTTLPLRLTGTVMQENPIDSAAVLHNLADNSTQTLKPGDIILEGAELVLAVQNRVYLQHGDQLVFLPLSDLPSEMVPPEQNSQSPLVPDAVLTLRRTEIDKALKDNDELVSSLTTGSLDLEGKRLLKLTEVEPGGLYDLLGLQSKDVLMQVDGKWVHNQQNPLWNALRTQNKVTLIIMRKGFPKTFQYLINEDRQ